MRKINFLYLTVPIFVMTFNETAWADRSHHYRSHSHHHSYPPTRYSFGLGLSPAYGTSLYGYYGSGRSGFYGSYSFGVPYAPYYYRPYYGYGGYMPPPYYPPVVVVPATPPVYIQQPSTTPSTPSPETNYWYYCENPAGYYPYVKKCPGGWLQVSPRPIE